jgi:ethanolamine utilization protein EutN
MLLAKVEGSVTSTKKHPSLAGWRMLICQPTDFSGREYGTPIIAIDSLGAANGNYVLVSSDGSAARAAVGDPLSPVRMMIVGVVDKVENVALIEHEQ